MLARASTPDVASRPARPTRTIRRAARSSGSSSENIRLLENIDEIWVFSESATLAAATNDRRTHRASDREERRRRCVKHVKRLLKKIWRERPADALATSNPARIERIAPK